MTRVDRKIKFILVSVILSFILSAVLAEVCLGVKESYQKKSTLDYIDTKRNQGQRLGWGGFLKENLNIYVTDGLGGQVRWTNNAAGFRSDREFAQEPPPGVLRILSLGDSFNAGFRVGQDETMFHRQNEWIKRHYGQAEILVPETEQPTTAFYYLKKYGLQLKPHIVLLGITLGNDIVDPPPPGFDKAAYKIPGDYLESESPSERFIREVVRWVRKRRLLRRFYQQHEAITSYFGGRHNLNLFDFNNGLGVFTNPLPQEIEEAYQRLFRILEDFALICRQHGIIFAVQLFPQRYQVQPEDWASTVEEYGLKTSRFNLMGPNEKIIAFCREHGIVCIDPTAAMAKWYSENQKPMYLPRGDMHWNKEGHRAFFECSLPAFAILVREGFQEVQAHKPAALSKGKTRVENIERKTEQRP